MEKVNCWEYMKCGREPGGKNVSNDGLCPATTAFSADGFNSGKNGGRLCWAIAGSLCSVTQGKFARAIPSCLECDFYMKVVNEEVLYKHKVYNCT